VGGHVPFVPSIFGGQWDGFHVDTGEFFAVDAKLKGEVKDGMNAAAFVWHSCQG